MQGLDSEDMLDLEQRKTLKLAADVILEQGHSSPLWTIVDNKFSKFAIKFPTVVGGLNLSLFLLSSFDQSPIPQSDLFETCQLEEEHLPISLLGIPLGRASYLNKSPYFRLLLLEVKMLLFNHHLPNSPRR